MKKNIYSSKKYIISIILLLLVVLFGLIAIQFNKNKKNANVTGVIQEGIIPGYTEEQIKEMMQRKADESAFSFEINSRPVFEDGSSEGNLRIANPPYNKYAISVDITLDSNGKKIFESGRVEPKHYIEKAKLNKKLEAGEYNATAVITAYDTETEEYKGTTSAKLIIKVKN